MTKIRITTDAPLSRLRREIAKFDLEEAGAQLAEAKHAVVTKESLPLRRALMSAYRQIVHSSDCTWRGGLCNCAVDEIERALGLYRGPGADWGRKLDISGFESEEVSNADPDKVRHRG